MYDPDDQNFVHRVMSVADELAFLQNSAKNRYYNYDKFSSEEKHLLRQMMDHGNLQISKTQGKKKRLIQKFMKMRWIEEVAPNIYTLTTDGYQSVKESIPPKEVDLLINCKCKLIRDLAEKIDKY